MEVKIIHDGLLDFYTGLDRIHIVYIIHKKESRVELKILTFIVVVYKQKSL